MCPSRLPANRHEDLWGKWGVTCGPTHARLQKLLLWCGELIGLQVEKQAHVPDVDCKYPAVIYSTHVGLSLRPLPWHLLSRSWLLGYVCDPTCHCAWGHCPGQWRHMWSDGEIGARAPPSYANAKSALQTWRCKRSSVTSNINYYSMSSASSVTFTAVKPARLPVTFPSQGFCL